MPDFLENLTYLIIGASFTAIGGFWNYFIITKKEKRERYRKLLDEYNEALVDYEIAYKNTIEMYINTEEDEDIFESFDQNEYKEEANRVLKKLIIISTKASFAKEMVFDTNILIPSWDILNERIVNKGEMIELYEKAVNIIDKELSEVRSQITHAYKKLD